MDTQNLGEHFSFRAQQ